MGSSYKLTLTMENIRILYFNWSQWEKGKGFSYLHITFKSLLIWVEYVGGFLREREREREEDRKKEKENPGWLF